MPIHRRLALLALVAFAACQEYPTSPETPDSPLFSKIASSVSVAVPITIPQLLDGPMYPGPVGIAIAPLESLSSYRLLNPLEGNGQREGVAQYVAVSFLPGGHSALAVATIPSEVPSYWSGIGWSWLVKFDIETGAVEGKLLLEGVPGLVYDQGGSAWRMEVSRDGKRAYVSLFYSEAIAVVDLRSMELVRYVSLPTPAGSSHFYPQDPELIEAGKALLVNDQPTGQVLRIDTETFEVQEAVPPEHPTSTSLSVSNDGKVLLVSSANSLDVVDLRSGTQLASIPCLRPTGHQFLPGDRKVVMTCRDEDRLRVVDRKDWSVLWELAVSGQPHRISVDPSGRFGVAATWATNELVLIDLSSREILERVEMPNRIWAPVFWPGQSKD